MKVRSFDVRRFPLHDGSDVLFAPLSNAMKVEPAFVASVLARCGVTATLEDHAARVAQGIGPAGVDVLALLRRLAADGFLVSHDALAEAMPNAAPASRPPLERLVIPTKARPQYLARAVASFTENARRFGRTCHVLVVDDDPAGTAAAVLAGSNVEVLDRAARTAMVDALARDAGVERELLAWALAPADPSLVTTGSARNAALLACAGHRYVSVDDDQTCRLVATSEADRPAFAVASIDPTELTLFRDASARATHAWTPLDYLGAHDAALGNDAATVIRERRAAGEATFEQASGLLVRALLDGPRTVVATSTGYAGDSGMGTNAAYLFLRGPARARLFASGDWTALRASREVIRASRAAVLADAGVGMGGGLGLDARGFIPPWSPTGRNQDGAFAAVLRACRPHDPTAWLPLAVLHEPDARPPVDDPLTRGASMNRFNDLIGHIASGWSSPLQDPEARARALGADLVAWGESPRALEEHLRVGAWRRRSAGIEHLERTAADAAVPLEYRADARALARALRVAMLNAPLQTDDLGSPASTRAGLVAYGRLLSVWGDVLRAARRRG